MIALFDDEKTFLKEEGRIQEIRVKSKNLEATANFTNLETGTYAVAIYHDENDNGEMDTNMLGIPTEGYGFSNEAQGFMGPPKFKDAAFTLEAPKRKITVKVQY